MYFPNFVFALKLGEYQVKVVTYTLTLFLLHTFHLQGKRETKPSNQMRLDLLSVTFSEF